MKIPRVVFFLLILVVNAASGQYALRPAFPQLPFLFAPVDMETPNDGTNRIFIVQLKGMIVLFENDPLVSTSKVFLDLTDKVPQGSNELGVLGLAFHPQFKTNGFFYVNYLSYFNGQLTSFISRFQVSPSNPDSAMRGSEQVLLSVTKIFIDHNGGHLAFGPDGYLYASFGDGGGVGDTSNNAQNPSVLLGKILRLDVNTEADGNEYGIPPGNPFAGNTAGFRKEIYAYGFRNPWKFSFDDVSGSLWAGDVGQSNYEEIDTIINGGNYGWRIMEGDHRFTDLKADTTKLILPVWEYTHDIGVAIIGGYVYHGNSLPEFTGKYIYGDYGSARIWALADDDGIASNRMIIDHDTSGIAISSFGEDHDRNLYVLSITNGKIYKIVSTSGVGEIHLQKNYTISADHTLLDGPGSNAYINFTLPQREHVILSVLDISGRERRRDLDGEMEAGQHSYRLDGRMFSNGMYFIRLLSNSGALMQKIVVMR